MRIKAFLERVRRPGGSLSWKRRIAEAAAVILLGALLGVLQKWLDSTPSNALPTILQQVDLRNYFGRLAIWIFLASAISIYAASPLQAAVHTCLFFLSMLAGYYLYCGLILGFLPTTYMRIWIAASLASFFPAYLCWYAKGSGIAAICISGTILGVLLAQAVSLTQGFYVYHFPEVLTWAAGVLLLKRQPKEYAIELGLSVVIAFLYQLILPHWG